MGRDTRMLNPVSIRWQRTAYTARCRCGETSGHPKLTAAERWATAHRCKETTMRPPAIAELLGVWDAQGPFRLDVIDAVQLVAWVKTLEQRNAAARIHVDRARRLAPDLLQHGDGCIDTQLVAALDVLRGEWTWRGHAGRDETVWTDADPEENDR